MDLDKLSYRAYGNLILIVLISITLLLNLFPFSLIGFIVCGTQIPIFLIARQHFGEPIHANGLNKCFAFTTLFYILLFICIKGLLVMTNVIIASSFGSILTVLSCYITSTMPANMEKLGKLFFGYKKHSESKYQKLVDFVKFNGINTDLLEAEEKLKKMDSLLYLIYKRKFRDNKTFKEISEEFDMDNPRIVECLDKVYFYMIGALKI